MLAAVLALALPCLAAGSITPEMEVHLQKGLDGIYSMDFDLADRSAQEVIKLAPEHPHGYFGWAAAAMMRYIYETEQGDHALVKLFEERSAIAAEKAKAWLKTHPDDAEVMVVYGATFGVAARLQAIKHQWIRAYFTARKAIAWQKAALKADPACYDAYLGIGMYDYYTDVYPSFIGVLSKVMLRGNRKRGIEELRLASEKGRFSNVVADLLLVEIAIEDRFGARDPAEGLRLMAKIRKRYPHSAMLHAAEISALYEAGRFDEVKKASEEFLSKVSTGAYAPMQEAKGRVLLGTALWALEQREAALQAMLDGAKVRFNGGVARYAMWATIRAGQLYDALGRREDAVRMYKEAALLPDPWDFRRYAEAGLRRPYGQRRPKAVSPLDADSDAGES